MINKINNRFKQMYNVLSFDEKKQFVVIFVLSFIGIFLDLFGIGMIFPILDLIISGEDNFIFNFDFIKSFFLDYDQNSIIFFVITFFLIFFVIKTLFSTFVIWYEKKFVYLTTYKLGSQLLEKYLKQNILELIKKKQSDLVRNILFEAGLFVTGIIFNLIKLILEFILIAGIAIIIIYFDPISSVLSLSIVGVFVVFYILIFKKKLRRYGKERQEIVGNLIKVLNDGFIMHKEIRLLDKSNFLHERYNKQARKAADIGIFEQMINSLPKIYFELFAVIGISFIIYFYIIVKSDVNAALPIMGLYAAAVFRVLPSASRIINSFNSLIHNMPVFDIMYEELKDIDREEKKKTELEVKSYFVDKNKITTIELKNLSFSYNTHEKKKIVLDNIDFEIKKNEVTGLIGLSGSGKSTIANILSGLIEDYDGEILVNKKIVKKNELKYKVGYVPQITNLIDDTILNNICFGINSNEINKVKLNNIIEKINLESLINSLPKGLETFIGEQGLTLSGGQRQRIALARTLYLEPEIIIFDESTSSLDSKSEKEFIENIIDLKNEKIILFISHDQNLEKYFNKIYKINNQKLEIIKNCE